MLHFNMTARVKIYFSVITLIFLFFALGCEDDLSPEPYAPKLVLDAYLEIGQPVSAEVSWTQSLFDPYDSARVNVSNANVIAWINGIPDTLQFRIDTVFLRDIQNGDTLVFQRLKRHFVSLNYMVTPNTQYRVEVKLPTGEFIYGETNSPNRFTLLRDSLSFREGDTITFSNGFGSRMRLRWLPDTLADKYWVKAVCHDTTRPKLREFRGVFGQQEPDRVSYWTQDAIDSFIPWFFFHYEGWHTVKVYNIREEFRWYLWTLTRFVENTAKMRMNVVGGYGMVTAYGVDSVHVFVKKH